MCVPVISYETAAFHPEFAILGWYFRCAEFCLSCQKVMVSFFPFLWFLFSVFFFIIIKQIDYKACNRTWLIHFTFLLNGKLVRSENVVPQHTRLQKLLKRCTVANYNHPAKDRVLWVVILIKAWNVVCICLWQFDGSLCSGSAKTCYVENSPIDFINVLD